MRLMKKEIKRSDKKVFKFIPKIVIGRIWKPGTRKVTSQIKITLITKENNPSVTTLIGKKSTLRMGLRIFCNTVKTIAAKMRVVKLR